MTQATNETSSHAVRAVADWIETAPVETRVTVTIQPVGGADTATVARLADWLGVDTGTIPSSEGGTLLCAERTIGRVTICGITHETEPLKLRRDRLAAELAELDAQIGAAS